MKRKISDEQIIELIEQGENNTGIAKKLEATVGGLNGRIKQLRKEHAALPKVEEPKKILPVAEQPIDLQKLDTVRIGDIRYRVTGIEQDCLLLREVMSDEERKWSQREPELLVIKKQDYLDGKTGIVKQNTPPVTSYIDESLKKQKEEPMYSEVVKVLQNHEELVESVTVNQTEAVPTDEERTVCSRISMDDIPEDIFGAFMAVMATDARELVEYRRELQKQIDTGQPVNINMVNRYNRVVRHYYG